jgi:hypothetical protein
LFKYSFPFLLLADSALYKINNAVMPVLLSGTVEFVRNAQVSALDKFYCIKMYLGDIAWGAVEG